MRQVYKDFISCVNYEQPLSIPFAIWVTGPVCSWLAGVNQKSYYLDPKIKLDAQLGVVRQFPDAILFPGPYPEFGAGIEPSIFGCEIVWHENDAPNSLKALETVEDIDRLTVPKDVGQAGIIPERQKQLEYFWKHIPESMIEDYGFLDGLAYFLGPLETAATVLNYTEFLIQLYLDPKRIHKLLDIVTEGIMESIRLQEKINGTIKRIAMADHMAHQLSPEMFREFCLPYYKRIFDEFSGASLRLYHNEGSVGHVVEMLPEMGANIFHYGADTKMLQEKIGDKFALMGNIDPLAILLDGTPEQVYEAATHCLREGSAKRGFVLSSAGGMSYGTPPENIAAAIKAAKDFKL